MASNRNNSRSFPRHHPLHGRPHIVVHVHDVLCGRGVNIAQHPGNLRFRSLVNTRYDPSYCTNFSTCEKQILASEVIEHIRSLNPPGRFLKRNGRSNSARGLEGPWEELTSKECVKKTCQALRDCNRNDRTGYGAAVTAPEDVQQTAKERRMSGLSLKEHAAAKVGAGSRPKTKIRKKAPPSVVASNRSSSKRSNKEVSSAAEDDSDAASLKKQRTEEPTPVCSLASSFDAPPEMPTSAGVSAAAFATLGATPTGPPHIAAVPVTRTPVQYNHVFQVTANEYGQLEHHHHHPGSQSSMMPSAHYPDNNNHHQFAADAANSVAVAAIQTPYSPVVWNHHGAAQRTTSNRDETEEHHEPLDIMDDLKPPYRQNLRNLFEEDASEDIFRTVAANAAAGFAGNGIEGSFPIVHSGTTDAQYNDDNDVGDYNHLNGFGLE